MDIAEENPGLRNSQEKSASGQASMTADRVDVLPVRGWPIASKKETMAGEELRIRLDERDRIARELHDSTSQLLVALELQLLRLGRLPLATESNEFEEVMAELGATLADLHMEVRGIGNIGAFNSHSLTNGLPEMAAAFGSRTGIAVDIRVGELPPGISPEIASALYRVAQEALANVTRHSRARNVRLNLSASSDCILLRIADDGVGFPPPSAMPAGRGIANMTARLGELGGRLSLRNLRHGAVVEAKIGLKSPRRQPAFLLSNEN